MRILGIDFRTDGPDLPAQVRGAGLVVVPSGPGLAVDLPTSPAYRQALTEADWVIPDSGLMVLTWNVRHPRRRLARYSGLRLLREVLPRAEIQAPGATFWVMPTAAERDRNLAWLQANGFPHLAADDCYVAPFYRPDAQGHVADPALLAAIERHRPAVVFLNVGGGVQEQLGWYLRKNLSFVPGILCTGAAIAFLTGAQAAIPEWADRFYLGWLLRTLRDPRKFGHRYWNSIGLIAAILRHGARSPVSG